MSVVADAEALVIGAGLMGAGIAQVLIQAGVPTLLIDQSADALAAAQVRIDDGIRRKHANDDHAAAGAVAILHSSSELPDGLHPTLAIEAVPERAELKRKVFADLERACPNVEVLASNTSSLSISELAGGLASPERFLGMHFFNPVPRSALVELVLGDKTSFATTTAAQRWVERLGLEDIVVRDSPGFATSRLGVAIGLEAIRMVEEGVAEPADIDRGMMLGYKFPIGPLHLTDLVGLDVRLDIAEHLHKTLGPRFEPPQLMRTMVAEGKLGRKSGEGFFQW